MSAFTSLTTSKNRITALALISIGLQATVDTLGAKTTKENTRNPADRQEQQVPLAETTVLTKAIHNEPSVRPNPAGLYSNKLRFFVSASYHAYAPVKAL